MPTGQLADFAETIGSARLEEEFGRLPLFQSNTYRHEWPVAYGSEMVNNVGLGVSKLLWRTKRVKGNNGAPVIKHEDHLWKDQSNQEFNLVDQPNQELYLALDLIGLYIKTGNLCDNGIF